MSNQSAMKTKASGALSRLSQPRDRSHEDLSPSKMADNKAVSIKFPDTSPMAALEQPILGGTQRLKPGMSNAVKAANDDLYEAEK